MFRLFFSFLASLLSIFLLSNSTPVPLDFLDDETVVLNVTTRDLQTRAIRFVGWDGCGDGPGSQKEQIVAGWTNMVEMGRMIQGNVVFEETVSLLKQILQVCKLLT
jgi:hypothetical protein